MAHVLFLLSILKSMCYIILNQGLVSYSLAQACFFSGLQAKSRFYTFKGLEGKKEGKGEAQRDEGKEGGWEILSRNRM